MRLERSFYERPDVVAIARELLGMVLHTRIDGAHVSGPQRDRAVETAHHDVARRAYAKFLERGGEHGHDVQDWLEAEAELRAGRGA